MSLIYYAIIKYLLLKNKAIQYDIAKIFPLTNSD